LNKKQEKPLNGSIPNKSDEIKESPDKKKMKFTIEDESETSSSSLQFPPSIPTVHSFTQTEGPKTEDLIEEIEKLKAENQFF